MPAVFGRTEVIIAWLLYSDNWVIIPCYLFEFLRAEKISEMKNYNKEIL